MTTDIRATLTGVPNSKAHGEFILPTLRIHNEGSEPVEVSNRLNLFEGDVLIRCTDPNGEQSQLRGIISVDTLPRTVELSTGQWLESGLFLFYTAEGFTFNDLGSYSLTVEYHPGFSDTTVTSDPIDFQIIEPPTEEMQILRDKTMVDEVGRAIALCGLETDPTAIAPLESLGEQFPDRPEGAIARFALGEITDTEEVNLNSIFDRWGPTTTARWITALLSSESTEESTKREYLDTLDRSRRIIRGEAIG
ncbi:hypothetical protein [Halorubrum sp. Ea8]|uniref:hypothetical protein n=1 Tax=Halorubrum sp. Ea8 TaxID=1383841 RepID=UPI0011405613|nr:hypothetical protein [Halorubrum sp. Ea8]